MEISAYHGTSSNQKESIDKYGFDPEKCNYRPDHWLGQGVYFFVDENQANWWAKTISEKYYNNGSVPIIYCVLIQADDMDQKVV